MRQLLRHRNIRLYALGQVLILAGAWSIEAVGSLLPMALAASAGVMLSMPLVRERCARLRASSRR